MKKRQDGHLEWSEPMLDLKIMGTHDTVESELDELVELAVHDNDKPLRKMMLRQYGGFNLQKKRTLQDVGEEHSVSDECVRQHYLSGIKNITQYAERYSSEKKGDYLPVSRAALIVLEEVAPISSRNAAALLYRKGLTNSKTFSIEGFLSAVEDCGIPVSITCERAARRLQSRQFIVPRGTDKKAISEVVSHANRKIIQHGAYHTDALLAEITQDNRKDSWRLLFIISALECRPDFRWLEMKVEGESNSGGWFTLTEALNPILARLNKMFSVADGIDEDTLDAAIAYSYNTTDKIPMLPTHIIGKIGVANGILDEAAFCALPRADIKHIYYRAGGVSLDPKEVMAPMEYDVWKCINSAGGACQMAEIGGLAQSRNDMINLRQKLITSPLFHRLERGIYGSLPASPMRH